MRGEMKEDREGMEYPHFSGQGYAHNLESWY